MTSRRVLNKLAKIHLANMLNCIKIENDDASSIEEVKSSKIVDDATFDIFEEEFKKEKIKIINFLEKSLGFELPISYSLTKTLNLYKEIEGKK
jgi:hypothetical protein